MRAENALLSKRLDPSARFRFEAFATIIATPISKPRRTFHFKLAFLPPPYTRKCRNPPRGCSVFPDFPKVLSNCRRYCLLRAKRELSICDLARKRFLPITRLSQMIDGRNAQRDLPTAERNWWNFHTIIWQCSWWNGRPWRLEGISVARTLFAAAPQFEDGGEGGRVSGVAFSSGGRRRGAVSTARQAVIGWSCTMAKDEQDTPGNP